MYHILQTMNDFFAFFYLVYYLDGYFSIADSLIDMICIQTGKHGLWSVSIVACNLNLYQCGTHHHRVSCIPFPDTIPVGIILFTHVFQTTFC